MIKHKIKSVVTKEVTGLVKGGIEGVYRREADIYCFPCAVLNGSDSLDGSSCYRTAAQIIAAPHLFEAVYDIEEPEGSRRFTEEEFKWAKANPTKMPLCWLCLPDGSTWSDAVKLNFLFEIDDYRCPIDWKIPVEEPEGSRMFTKEVLEWAKANPKKMPECWMASECETYWLDRTICGFNANIDLYRCPWERCTHVLIEVSN